MQTYNKLNLVLIDNYDSFTYNIVHYFEKLKTAITVYKNDEISTEELKYKNFDAIILSPGPSNPDNAGITLDVIKEFAATKPILGICLGFQAIAQHYGAKIIRAEKPMHGMTSQIYFTNNEPLFAGMPQPFTATRYHSLIVDTGTLTPQITPTAYTNNTLMGIKITGKPVYGVQFHPESILTENGIQIFKNFLKIINLQQTCLR